MADCRLCEYFGLKLSNGSIQQLQTDVEGRLKLINGYFEALVDSTLTDLTSVV